ncbi:MAG TPA: nucleoside triphosphatase YtkD [Bacillota bacterium]|nr:nucleoside triphosphatase YtkD [Bacillota bacterium]
MDYIFLDTKGNRVSLKFDDLSVEMAGEHVWILCRYQGRWLLTKHRERGLEFPGGKVEFGETPREAAIREVMEETGAEIEKLQFIGQYKVFSEDEVIVKNIYFAEIKSINEQSHYFETEGPRLIDSSLLAETIGDEYSFIMKDDVLQKSLQYLREKGFL